MISQHRFCIQSLTSGTEASTLGMKFMHSMSAAGQFHHGLADDSCMRRLVNRAGGRLRLPKGCEGLEVSPTVSYSGEGLRAICRGRTFRQAHDVFLQVCCMPLADVKEVVNIQSL